MEQISVRLIALLTFVIGDVALSWLAASAVGSFVTLSWVGAHLSPLGRAAWLLLFAFMAKGSIPSAKATADRILSRRGRTQADA